MARWYGGALTSGLEHRGHQELAGAHSRRHRRTGARCRAEMAGQEALGDRLSDQGHYAQARGETLVSFLITRRAALIGGAAALALTSLASSPSQAAAKIQRLVSPGGIEAWFVQDATVPLIAMEYAFGGGASQDPPAKPGVGNMVASLLDEGAAISTSKTFHERLERRAIELSFSSSRDTFRGSLRMLKENKDEAFDLLAARRLTAPRFDATDIERIRNQVLSSLRREFDQPDLAGGPQIPRSRLRRSSLRPFLQRNAGDVPTINGRRPARLCRARDREGYAAHRRGRRRRPRHARQAARQDLWRPAGQGQTSRRSPTSPRPSRRSAPSFRSTCRRRW